MFQLISTLVIAALVGFDQIVKYIINEKLASGDTVTLIPGVLRLECIYNYGGMWGLFKGKATLLAVFTAAILLAAFIFLLMKKIPSMFVNGCMIAIIAGGIGNLIDRAFRGYVIDYIDTVFVNFPTYNFADCLVTVGCFLFMGYVIYDTVRDVKKKKQKS